MNGRRLISFLLAWFAVALVALDANAQTAFPGSRVSVPELRMPERGSLAGQFAETVFGPADVGRGAFSLPSPFETPNDRGELLATPFPVYSPDAPLTEWGMGWSSQLSIKRFRALGDIDYATDDLVSPWGRLVLGEDGLYYPQGLSSPVRIEVRGDTVVAFAPDGNRYTFGGSETLANERGTFAWYLVDVESAVGTRTHFTYEANVSGRRFLTSVDYGGVHSNVQYRIELAYTPLARSVNDYASGSAVALDRRVSEVRILAKNNTIGSFVTRWSYVLEHEFEDTGYAFYLTRVARAFPSGVSDPPTVYTYALAKDHLATTRATRSERIANAAATFGPWFYLSERAAPVDLDRDGRIDLESATDNSVFLQNDDGFTRVPLPPAPPDASAYCRLSGFTGSVPRTLVRAKDDDAEPLVWSLVPTAQATTVVTLCDRAGSVLHVARPSGVWKLGPLTRIADVDRDGKPDVVQVWSNNYSILPNTSSEAGYSFGEPIRGSLDLPSTPLAMWVEDANGDGIVDLIAGTDGDLTVYYGKGRRQFERTGVRFRVLDGNIAVAGLSSFSVTWLDANKDGVADVLLSKSNKYYLFTNQGNVFRRVAIPALVSLSSGATPPIPLDLVGSGDTELVFTDGEGPKSIALDTPSSGLLVRANDGKGTELEFGYGRSPAIPGARQRQSILRTLKTRSVGEDELTYEYDYAEPRFDSVSHSLIGYSHVTRRGAADTRESTFLNEDRYAGVLLSEVERDPFHPLLERVRYRTYDDVVSFGIPWKRLLSEGVGWASTDPLAPRTVLDETRYASYVDEVCPETTVATSVHGELTTTSSYDSIERFDGHLACLARRTAVVGRHANAALDFSHALRLERDARGLVLERILEGENGDVLDQAVTYTIDGLVETSRQPGRGTTTIAYDEATRLRVNVTSPTGVSVAVAASDPTTDQILDFVTAHGSRVSHSFFRFDGRERLVSSWNDLGSASEATPNMRAAYRFASTEGDSLGLVQLEVLARIQNGIPVWSRTAELMSGAGTSLASLSRIPEGFGVASLKASARALRRVDAYARAPLATTDATTVTASQLYAGADLVGSTSSTGFGVEREVRESFHASVERVTSSALALTHELAATKVENGTFTSVDFVDAAMRPYRSRDASGAEHRFTYDALGRVREVVLPTGEHHTTTYDSYGRVRSIDRTGVAHITYEYETATGLATSIAYSAPSSNVAERTVAFSYDTTGRVTRETHRQNGDEEEIHYFYDGATDDDPSRRDQLGFKTGVEGPGFKKRFSYRADGKVQRSELVLTGFRSVITEFAYDEDGEEAEVTTEILDAAGARISRVTSSTERDAFGRAARLLIGGEELVSYAYDAQGLLDFATFSKHGANEEIVTFQRDGLTRRPTGHNVVASSWSAATSSHFDRRGLIEREAHDVNGVRSERTFGYTPAKYLASSHDANGDTESYAYDASGLRTSISTNGSTAAYARAGTTLTAGDHTYTFDALGRVVAKDDTQLTYSPRGHVREASNGQRSWSYLYDEGGHRLAKLEQGTIVAAFPQDGTLLDPTHGLVAPLEVGGVIVGTLHHGVLGTSEETHFEPMVADERGTRLSNRDGSATFASPWGVRDAHPDFAQAIDFAAKGWDEDLGVVRMGVRDYDPTTSLFTTPDPYFLEHPEACVSRPDECNLYSYAKNQPNLYSDPSGGAAMLAAAPSAAAWTVGAIALAATAAYVSYLSLPPDQKRAAEQSLMDGLDASVDAAGTASTWAKTLGIRVALESSLSWERSKAKAFERRFDGLRYVFATYTVKLANGSIYSGRTSGIVKKGETDRDGARRAVSERWTRHHMNGLAMRGEMPQLEAYVAGDFRANHLAEDGKTAALNYAAIRGREQQLIDANGKAQSEGGTSGNRIRGVAVKNGFGVFFDSASHAIITPQFGPAARKP